MCIGESERHVKEGSRNGQLFPIGAILQNLEGFHLLGTVERQMKGEGSGSGASLTMGAL